VRRKASRPALAGLWQVGLVSATGEPACQPLPAAAVLGLPSADNALPPPLKTPSQAGSYQLCWLLLLPLVNYLKDLAARVRASPQGDEEVEEEVMEDEEEEADSDYEL
jgi:hypothetical protein